MKVLPCFFDIKKKSWNKVLCLFWLNLSLSYVTKSDCNYEVKTYYGQMITGLFVEDNRPYDSKEESWCKVNGFMIHSFVHII